MESITLNQIPAPDLYLTEPFLTGGDHRGSRASFHRPPAHLPTVWERTDEWYDFMANPRGKVHVLASLDVKSISGSAMQAAIAHLAARGHRCAAYVAVKREGWQMGRAAALQRAARTWKPEFRVLESTTLSQEEWDNPTGSRVIAELDSLASCDLKPVVKAMKYFAAHRNRITARLSGYLEPAWIGSPYAGIAAMTKYRQTHPPGLDTSLDRALGMVWAGLVLVPILKAGATALIAPNDHTATQYHLHWLQDLRPALPGHFSILSFDNYYYDSFLPLTSVNFGFANLGYQAFHALMGDVPVARGRNGDIPARAQVMDRGSVAAIA